MAELTRPHGRFLFWSVWFLCAAVFFVCRVTLFDPVFYNIDEAEYAVSAQALTHGFLPGADLLGSTKPPGIVFLYSAVFALFGDNLLAIQWTGFLLWLVLLFVTMRLGKLFVPDSPEWMSAVCFVLLSNTFGLPRDMHALNVELPGMVLVLGALLLAAKSKSKRALFVAGLLFGLAMMFRQSMALFLIAALFFFSSDRFRRFALLSAGAALPWTILFVVYAAAGKLSTALESWIRYPLLYSADTGWTGFLQAFWLNTSEFVLQAAVPVLFSLIGLFVVIRAKQTALLALFLLSALAVAAGSRFFGHYYIQIMPALAMFGAAGVKSLYSISEKFKRVTQAALAIGVVAAVLHFPFWRYWDDTAPPNGISAESLDYHALEIELAEFAAQNSTPEQTIFVWGYCPQIYFHANRLPGARDFLCHYVTGYSAGTNNPRANARGDAEQMLIGDLKKSKPQLLFDLSFIDNYFYSFKNYPLTEFPMLAEYIRSHYRPAAQVGSVAIYSLISKSPHEL